ncbi:hypothetical protein [Alkaliphilus transvaalensis]|uniref:hypothetical protein n=1 Tax=Alkaliphilus transvaalensis TaxID=114628 RepID=UPI00047B12E1|nr:hypothetical protein [Alkaliphilus transvaalensis]
MNNIKDIIPVINHILPLLSTIDEAILHVQNQLVELRYEESLTMLYDVLEGIASIETALHLMEEKFQMSRINEELECLKNGLRKVLNSYENKEQAKLENLVVKDVYPTFSSWKEEIERLLKPYVTS